MNSNIDSNVNSDINNDDDDLDLDSLLAESLLELEKKKALKKISRDKVNSRLLTEDQVELLKQEENLKWVTEDSIMFIEVLRCKACGDSHSVLRGFYISQSRLNSPQTKRLLATDYNNSTSYKSFTVIKESNFCALCVEPSTDCITPETLPILKGLL